MLRPANQLCHSVRTYIIKVIQMLDATLVRLKALLLSSLDRSWSKTLTAKSSSSLPMSPPWAALRTLGRSQSASSSSSSSEESTCLRPELMPRQYYRLAFAAAKRKAAYAVVIIPAFITILVRFIPFTSTGIAILSHSPSQGFTKLVNPNLIVIIITIVAL